MTDVVICEFMDEAAVDLLRQHYDVLYDPRLVDDETALFEAISDVPALIVRSSAWVNQRLLDHGPKLQVIGRLGVGMEKFDLPACAASGVTVCPATGANELSVAEYTLTMACALLRGAYQANAAMIAGEWPRQQMIGQEASGKVLGIIGLGRIGSLVARMAGDFGMRVIASDPYIPDDDPRWQLAERLTQSALLANADVVTLHTPLTNETRNLLNAKAFAAMKPGACVINSARGGVVDETALAEALQSGHLGGAAIDVFANEPLTKQEAEKFAGTPNLFLTPHIAGVTFESNERVSRVTAENVMTVLCQRHAP